MKKMHFLLGVALTLLMFASPVMGAIEKASLSGMTDDSNVMKSDDMKDANSMMSDIIIFLAGIFLFVVLGSLFLSGTGLSLSGWAHFLSVRSGGISGILYALGSVVLVALAIIVTYYFYNNYIAS